MLGCGRGLGWKLPCAAAVLGWPGRYNDRNMTIDYIYMYIDHCHSWTTWSMEAAVLVFCTCKCTVMFMYLGQGCVRGPPIKQLCCKFMYTSVYIVSCLNPFFFCSGRGGVNALVHKQ